MSGQTAGQKRRFETQHVSSRSHKRQRTDIPTQHGNHGELNITGFIKTREFEIAALEKSMQKARKSLSSRAFQQVPRSMRRRTASHNAKKVPRRLRRKAEREMKDDNTPVVSKRVRTPSRKLRLRLETAKLLHRVNKRSKTKRQKKKEAKANANEQDPEKHIEISRVPRVKKNKLADPPKATSKYKRRQVNKTWLPTHLWHTKRAHMTRPAEPLWRMAIPLKPTEKSYRPSHRASSARGCIAWDASYMSTICCRGTTHTLENMLSSLGFLQEKWPASKLKKWKAGTRHAHGWLYEHDGQKNVIAPATVLWCAAVTGGEQQSPTAVSQEDKSNGPATDINAANGKRKKIKLDQKLFIRVHPSEFHQIWLQILRVAKMQKPQVLVEDLRFEVGSIELTGPGSTETLHGVLNPIDMNQNSESVVQIWKTLASLRNPASLPDGAMLAFETRDPRLRHPPKQIRFSESESYVDLNNLAVTWPVDTILSSPSMCSHKARYTASRSLPSQKAINRRKAQTPPGQEIELNEKDPKIPIILFATRCSHEVSNQQGSWTLLAPWSCIDPIWRSLMYYPLTSGGTPRFGGLAQMQQIAFEQMTPWFPGDLPGTEAGKAWERTEAEIRFDTWVRRPPSRRIAWDMVDLGLGRKGELGRGWTCDWEYLFEKESRNVSTDTAPHTLKKAIQVGNGKQSGQQPTKLLTASQRKAAKEATNVEHAARRNTSSPEPESEDDISASHLEKSVVYTQLSPPTASSVFKKSSSPALPAIPSLATIRIQLLARGTPKAAARIYRLPSQKEKPTLSKTRPNKPVSPTLDTQSSESVDDQHDDEFETIAPRSRPSLRSSASLRTKWLALDPNHPSHPMHKPDPKPLTATRQNHHGLSRLQYHHPKESLRPINVLPRDAPQEIIDQFAAKPLTPEQLASERNEALLRELMKGDAYAGGWSADGGIHVECPDAEDLIGFVTSGGFNLSQGRGTAIGGVWAQKVLEGWREDDDDDDEVAGQSGGVGKNTQQETSKQDMSESAKQQARKEKIDEKRRDRERHLCIVRNAGESIGRLAIWELC